MKREQGSERAPRRTVLRGGRVLDPSQNLDATGDLVIADGKIEAFEDATGAGYGDDVEIVDCGGLVVTPGFIDVHCHLREPGREDVETIATGSSAAAVSTLVSLNWPSAANAGTLIQLRAAKYTADVPTSTSRAKRRGMTQSWNGGAPACAIWLVKPEATPNSEPIQPGDAAPAVGGPCRPSQRRYAPNAMEMTPTRAMTAADETLAANR